MWTQKYQLDSHSYLLNSWHWFSFYCHENFVISRPHVATCLWSPDSFQTLSSPSRLMLSASTMLIWSWAPEGNHVSCSTLQQCDLVFHTKYKLRFCKGSFHVHIIALHNHHSKPVRNNIVKSSLWYFFEFTIASQY